MRRTCLIAVVLAAACSKKKSGDESPPAPEPSAPVSDAAAKPTSATLDAAPPAEMVAVAKETALAALLEATGTDGGDREFLGCESVGAGESPQLCYFSVGSDLPDPDDFVVALLARQGNAWTAVATDAIEIDPGLLGMSEPGDAPGLEVTASTPSVTSVAIAPDEQALDVVFEARYEWSDDDVGGSKTLEERRLYRIDGDKLVTVLELSSSKEEEFAPEGQDGSMERSKSYRLLTSRTDGYFDIEVATTESESNPMGDGPSETTTDKMTWNGSEYEPASSAPPPLPSP
jgi:hypothetical protein